MFIQAQIKNPTRSLENVNKGTSTVTTTAQILAWASGLAIPATSATVRSEIIGVCNQTIASADALTQVPVIDIFQQDTWVADCTNNSNPVHDGQRMVLTDSLTVNNTGTDSASGVVEQIATYGAAADRKILVRFV